MQQITKGDRVLFKRFNLYKGEIAPNIPPECWTGEVLDTWGMARQFARVQRDYDGRIIPLVINEITFLERPKPTKKRR